MAGSVPQDFIRDIVDTTDMSNVRFLFTSKEKGKVIEDSALFVMMVKILHLVSVSKSSFIFVSNVEASGNVIGFLQSHQGYDFISR